MKEGAIIPSKKLENAGYDIYACLDEDYMILKPFQTRLVPTGIAWASSPKFYLQIEERSSTGTKGIKKSAGVVDSGYRGEIKVAITNANDFPLVFVKDENVDLSPLNLPENTLVYCTKKAIAQGVVHRVEELDIHEISYEELASIPSERGDKGWGSSNK